MLKFREKMIELAKNQEEEKKSFSKKTENIRMRTTKEWKNNLRRLAYSKKLSITDFIIDAVDKYEKQLKKRNYISLKFLEEQLIYLNQIAWDYVSENNKLVWERYYELLNHPIWYLGVKTRERFEEIKTGIKPKGDFHHEPPYRNHWLSLFTTGEFRIKHKKGRMIKP